MFYDWKWQTLKIRCKSGQIEFMQREIAKLKDRIKELEKKNDGYQYDSNGNRVTVNGHLTKRDEYYTHHDTCKCKINEK